MALTKKIFLFVVMLCVRAAKPQPAVCLEDVHCMAGYFCAGGSHSCLECLRCDTLGRSPAASPVPNLCVTSVSQCGPCLQGLSNAVSSLGACTGPQPLGSGAPPRRAAMLLALSAAGGLLLSVCIALAIWRTRVIDIDIAMSSSSKFSKEKSFKPKQNIFNL